MRRARSKNGVRDVRWQALGVAAGDERSDIKQPAAVVAHASLRDCKRAGVLRLRIRVTLRVTVAVRERIAET